MKYVLFILIIWSNSYGQSVENLQHLHYWNTAPDYHFHYSKLRILEKSKSNSAALDAPSVNEEISKCYRSAPCRFPHTPNNTDTNLASVLERSRFIFINSDLINADYDEGNDIPYSVFLKAIYDYSNKPPQEFLFHKAEKLYDAIPNVSPKKPIAFLQMSWFKSDFESDTAFRIYSKGKNTLFEGRLRNNVLKAQSLSKNLTGYDRTMVLECSGDYWQSFGFIRNSSKSYQAALRSLREIPESPRKSLVIQRIREKLIELFLMDNESSHFNVLGADIVRSLETENHISEFNLHNKIIAARFAKSQLDYSHSFSLLHELNKLISKPTGLELKVDIEDLLFENSQRCGLNDQNDVEMSFIVLINYMCENNLVRYRRKDEILPALFEFYLRTQQYAKANIVSNFIRRLSLAKGDYFFNLAAIQKSRTFLAQGLVDSAANALCGTDTLFLNLRNYSRMLQITIDRSSLYKQLMLAQGRYGNYGLMPEKLQIDLFPNRADELKSTVSDIVNDERNLQDDTLFGEIDNLIELHNKDSLINLLQRNKFYLSDSLNKSEKQRLSDNARSKAIEAYAERQNNRLLGSLLIIVTILGTVIVLLVNRTRRTRELELNQEKLELEKENLKGAFFGHAIKRSFKNIVSRIRLGLEDNQPELIISAIGITQSLNLLLSLMSENISGQSSLFDELQMAKRYVDSISLTKENGPIEWKEAVPNIASEIMMPSHILIHFYVNSIWHGRLLEKNDAVISTELRRDTNKESFILEITDNGVGMENMIFASSSEGNVGGIKLAKRRFSSFNHEGKHDYRFEFDPIKDVSNVIDMEGKIQGLKIQIRIYRT